jgi:hypothetical protein
MGGAAAFLAAAAVSCELLVPAEISCRPGYMCAPPVPSGWGGPYAAFYGAPPGRDAALGCPVPMTLAQGKLQFDLDAGAACGCSCSPPTGATCGTVTLTATSGPGCPACPTSPSTIELESGACNSTGGFKCGTVRAETALITAQIDPGACTPHGAVSLPTPEWGGAAILCTGGDLESCGSSGGLCVPPAPTGFGSKPCIAQVGQQPCPEAYPSQHIAYGGFSDTRQCTPCTCDPPVGAKCTVDLSTSASATGCAGSHVTAQGPGCVGDSEDSELDLAKVLSLEAHFEAGGGSCEPDGGQLVGQASPKEPTTICCLQ